MDKKLVETIAEQVHEDWRRKKRAAGVTTRKAAETQEELMVPFAELSEPAKQLNRDPVVTVLGALEAAGFAVVSVDEALGAGVALRPKQ